MPKFNSKSGVKQAFFRLKVFGLQNVFKILGLISPSEAEELALHLFITPPHPSSKPWEKTYLQKAETSWLKVGDKNIKMYRWGSGPTVLFVHGWGGRAGQFSGFIEPWVDAGFSVLAFDGPAHGASSGKQSDIHEFSVVIHEIAKTFAPIHAVVAHSFGGAAVLLALREFHFQIPKLVMISCPASPLWVTNEFSKKLSIPRRIVDGFRKRLRARFDNRWEWYELSVSHMIQQTSMPVLLIHDCNDKEVPYKHAMKLMNARSNLRLITTKGEGHIRILHAPAVIGESLEFVKNAPN